MKYSNEIKVNQGTQQILVDYFRYIIPLHMQSQSDSKQKEGSTTRTSARQQSMKGRQALTTQILDRYIFCLNTVQSKKFIPVIDLIKEIRTDLEANRNFIIDKKTVKRIISILKAEDLVKTKDVRVTISYGHIDSDSNNGEQKNNKVVPKIVPIVLAPYY